MYLQDTIAASPELLAKPHHSVYYFPCQASSFSFLQLEPEPFDIRGCDLAY